MGVADVCIHNHLIPNVDDGSISIEMSIEMVKQYIKSGYKGAIVTPHYDKSRYVVLGNQVKSGVDSLKDILKKEKINFELYCGNEIQIDENSLDDIKEKKALRLNNSMYVLSELPFTSKPSYVNSMIYEFQLEGLIPIIAHPERYFYFQKDIDLLVDIIEKGALLQINLSSLSNSTTYETAKELLERNMVHFVSTDAHRNIQRSPDVKKELELLLDIVGEEKYIKLTTTNTKKVIDNEFVKSDAEMIVRKDNKNKKSKKRKFLFWR